jgi:hypothetical protein
LIFLTKGGGEYYNFLEKKIGVKNEGHFIFHREITVNLYISHRKSSLAGMGINKSRKHHQ